MKNIQQAREAADRAARRARRARLRLRELHDERLRQLGRVVEKVFPLDEPASIDVAEKWVAETANLGGFNSLLTNYFPDPVDVPEPDPEPPEGEE